MSERSVYDSHGSIIGKDVYSKDFLGRAHITHYNLKGDRVGRSYVNTSWSGEEYMVHENAGGKRVGKSELGRDWWGDYYIKTDRADGTKDYDNPLGDIYGEEEEPDSGGGGGILTALAIVVLAVAGVIWWIYYKIFSILGPLPVILFLTTFGPVGAVAVSISPVAVLLSVSILTYIPSLVAMIVLRIRGGITTNNMRTAGMLWCVIGPFAWIYLVLAMKKNKA